MSKWILMPDSFKGTMSSMEICQAMRRALLRHIPDAEIIAIPVADGGEGSVEAFLTAMGGRRVEVPCTGPDSRPVTGFYGLLPDGRTAVIEMAAAAGLPLMEGHLCAEGGHHLRCRGTDSCRRPKRRQADHFGPGGQRH